MKLFLSYCHKDENYLKNFQKHIAPLKRQERVTEWHDRKIQAGSNINEAIGPQLQSADVIVLFVSSNFMDSDPCDKEMRDALELQKSGVRVVPVILSPCCWKDSPLKDILVCPKDGKPISAWKDENEAWVNVVEELKRLLDNHALQKKELTAKFRDFADNPGTFVSSSRREVLKLRDFYVYPTLDCQRFGPDDSSTARDQKSAEFLTRIDSINKKNFMVLGDDLSGKTALCQMIYGSVLDSDHYVPVYIDGKNVSNNNWRQIEKSAFERQYQSLRHNIVKDDSKIVIFDNFGDGISFRDVFSLLSRINGAGYRAVVLMGSAMNSLFESLKWTQKAAESEIAMCRIASAGYHERANVVRKWITATHKDEDIQRREILEDRYREFVDFMFVENVMPSYFPSIIMVLETKSGMASAHVGASDEVSSYGHCYNALITHSLITKASVAPSDVNNYHAALAGLAYYMYANEKDNLTAEDIAVFARQYKEDYMGLPRGFIENLIKSGLLMEGLLDVRMHEYVFYYYVAWHMAQDFNDDSQREKVRGEIEKIFEGAHRKRNGQILLFLIHHMPKSSYLLGKLNEDIVALFGHCPEATLTADELSPLREFWGQLPALSMDVQLPESQRQGYRRARVKQDEARSHRDSEVSRRAEIDDEDVPLINISKSFRIMSIAGTLLKNEYATMKKEALKRLSANVRGIALRIVSFGHNIIAEHPDVLRSYLDNLWKQKSRDWQNKMPHEKEHILNLAMGVLVVDVACSMIDRCASCVGSDKLTALISDISDDNSCPSHQLVHLVASMRYGKRLDVKVARSLYSQWKKSDTVSAWLLQIFVVQYTRLHKIDMAERQRIAAALDLDIKDQILIQHKRSKR